MIEVQRAKDSVEQLRALRVPLTYREYDMGHEITPRSLTDLSAWLKDTLKIK
jgi:predicted esterase